MTEQAIEIPATLEELPYAAILEGKDRAIMMIGFSTAALAKMDSMAPEQFANVMGWKNGAAGEIAIFVRSTRQQCINEITQSAMTKGLSLTVLPTAYVGLGDAPT